MADQLPPRVRHAHADLLDAFERLAAAVMPALPDGAHPVDMFHNPRYIVFRAAPGLTLPARLDGRWEDANAAGSMFVMPPDGPTSATASPTGRYETRDDGVWAEVYEVSW